MRSQRGVRSFGGGVGGTAGVATHYRVSPSTASPVAGTGFTVQVTARDYLDNVCSGYTGTVHLTSTDSQAVLGADATLTNGVGTFAVTLKTAANQSVTATDTLSAGIFGSTILTVSPAAANKLVYGQQPTAVKSGLVMAPAVTAKIADLYGNVITSSTANVTVALTSAGGAALGGTLTRAAANGVATFGDLTVDTSGTYSLTATSSGLTNGVSSNFAVTGATLVHGEGFQGGPDAGPETLTPSPAPAAGNTLVLSFTYFKSTSVTFTITDTAGNVWRKAVEATPDAGSARCAVYYTNGPAAGGGCLTHSPYTLTIAFGGVNIYLSTAYAEFSGLWTAQPPFPSDQAHDANCGNAASTAVSSGNAATLKKNELAVGVMTHASGTQALAAGGGYAEIYKATATGTVMPISATYKAELGAAGNYAATWTAGAAVDWVAAIATFYSVGGGAFGPADLPGKLAFYRSDRGALTFNAADFLIASQQYVTTTQSSWLNGLTKLTLEGFAYLAGWKDGVAQCVAAQWDAGNTQACFKLVRTAANKLRVYVASSLTDAGANYLESSLTISGTTAGQKIYHLGVIFDGTASGNANRLKLYVNGTLDGAATYTGTIPAALTSSTAPFNFGFDGNSLYFEGQMYCWGAWAGTALTAGNMTALAAWNASGNPTYYNFAGLPDVGAAPTQFWEMSANGGGVANQGGANPAANPPLSNAGTAATKSFAQWADQYGNGNLAMSVLSQYSVDQNLNSVVAPPTLQPNVLNGLPAWQFVSPLGETMVRFKCGKLGLTTNPGNWTVFNVFAFDRGDQEPLVTGNSPASLPGQGASPDFWGFFDTNDLGESLGITTAYGDGTDKTAASSQNNVWVAGTPFCLALRYTSGDDHVRVWANGAENTYTKFQAPPLAVVTSCGGTMTSWSVGTVGDYDGTHDGPPAGFTGKYLLQIVLSASVTDAQRVAVEKWISCWTGLGF